ncbi:bifunctional UDP-N-acetylglucosamine diphosphorylase/glucosamine-1-phosphate N-acetyltransferase GlmU [Deferribacteraceae bacterium V6Fe1]|uniref:bifunctional UDP-N-acetylglucosamine diphosphorylase/glucosamine-1-phosphate N-acetyltransferase GlmU n=1 Tax=Deferrivibrio essentukiensis TaxID=2880922 RepID=UPI00199BEEF4|nr:bifunctional UDP-N-acetylglucosamine diphosphorylase/glucosamine-1-phosphate N-acetyltransferase GlmU [Deferrivibrio essentukiensis]MBC7196012.1 bifunctional UDP-N-acetylglucosamine diphosphorylase/glucosamine-1-phosphate N-acetyltransferase GlmU [Deferribacterales bacterium]MCB4204575.1 bifunctional UDP-N-acetylglucosamine diphosphorylase/glucosamine-1-phosphate N-acetyltransferase GlmU [Deferrivibrio essentukiensis]UOD33911.1 bifunctional UDP-N-acetylglucosamine diphosphorylase/glucosamine-
MSLKVVILAAGKGTRMKSEKPKVLFEVAGKPMIDYVVDEAKKLNPEEIVVIVGNQSELVRAHLKDKGVVFVEQTEQKGTGHALMCARDKIEGKEQNILVLCGDMPLVKHETLVKFIDSAKGSKVSFISVKVQNPTGYGRVIRGADKKVLKIVEEKDSNDNEKKVNEINTGVYLVNSKILLERLSMLTNENAQGEYYLTDIVKSGADVYMADDEQEFIGINDKYQLSVASKVIWKRMAIEHMKNGVQILDFENCYIDEDVKIGIDTVIYPNVYLFGKTEIGLRCKIYPGVHIVDSVIEDDVEIKDNSFITESFVGAKSSVGPMAQLRPGTKLLGENKIGNFVETKKALIGKGSKASHLTYLGDCEIGENVNVGCGTITCNYDGISKHKTIIGDNVFVGSDVQFVAPVKIGSNSLIGAGSTITKDVPDGALAVTRAEQKNIEGWVEKWRAKKMKMRGE